MADDLYSAPRAVVQDPALDAAPRPREVTYACAILWVVFFLNLLSLHPEFRGDWWAAPESDPVDGTDYISYFAVMALFEGIDALLIWLISRRHNWARWTLLILALVTTVVLAFDLPESFSETPAAAIADVLLILAEFWALRLLFFGAGTEWFRTA
jgi:hypothetical protein